MAQWLKALTALSEDLGSIPSTYMATPGSNILTQTYIQAKHQQNKNNFLKDQSQQILISKQRIIKYKSVQSHYRCYAAQQWALCTDYLYLQGRCSPEQ